MVSHQTILLGPIALFNLEQVTLQQPPNKLCPTWRMDVPSYRMHLHKYTRISIAPFHCQCLFSRGYSDLDWSRMCHWQLKIIPMFRGNFSKNRYPYLGIFLEKGTHFLRFIFCHKNTPNFQNFTSCMSYHVSTLPPGYLVFPLNWQQLMFVQHQHNINYTVTSRPSKSDIKMTKRVYWSAFVLGPTYRGHQINIEQKILDTLLHPPLTFLYAVNIKTSSDSRTGKYPQMQVALFKISWNTWKSPKKFTFLFSCTRQKIHKIKKFLAKFPEIRTFLQTYIPVPHFSLSHNSVFPKLENLFRSTKFIHFAFLCTYSIQSKVRILKNTQRYSKCA